MHERRRKYGANIFFIARKVGYCTFTLKLPTFAVAIPEDLRNALRNSPWRVNHIISAKRQNRVERQIRTERARRYQGCQIAGSLVQIRNTVQTGKV